jgi:hypothetical protein
MIFLLLFKFTHMMVDRRLILHIQPVAHIRLLRHNLLLHTMDRPNPPPVVDPTDRIVPILSATEFSLAHVF